MSGNQRLPRRAAWGRIVFAVVVCGFLVFALRHPLRTEADGGVLAREIVVTLPENPGADDKPVIVEQAELDDAQGNILHRRAVTCRVRPDGKLRFAAGFHGTSSSSRWYLSGLWGWQQSSGNGTSWKRWSFLWGLCTFRTEKTHTCYIVSRANAEIMRFREDALLQAPVSAQVPLADSLFSGEPNAPYFTRGGIVEVLDAPTGR